MPGAISFGARTTRDNNYVGVVRNPGTSSLANLGPGSYDQTASISKKAPGHAAFGSNAERQFASAPADTPQSVGPGSYEPPEIVQAPNTKRRQFTSTFRSTGKRFTPKTKNQTPGPGAYLGNDSWETVDRVAQRKYVGAPSTSNRPNDHHHHHQHHQYHHRHDRHHRHHRHHHHHRHRRRHHSHSLQVRAGASAGERQVGARADGALDPWL